MRVMGTRIANFVTSRSHVSCFSTTAGCKRWSVGESVQVNWKGMRWDAEIKSVDDSLRRVLVQFKGWSENWNEWLDMSSDRLSVFDELSSRAAPSLPSVDVETSSMEPATPESHSVKAVDVPSTSSNTRRVVEISIFGTKYQTSSLKNGCTVFLNPLTGLIHPSVDVQVVDKTLSSEKSIKSSSKEESSLELPTGWVKRADPTFGEPYYFNMVNQTAQWTQPRLSAAEVAKNMNKAVLLSPPLSSAGWEVFYDCDGVPSYRNAVTGLVQEVAPADEPAKTIQQLPVENSRKPENSRRSVSASLKATKKSPPSAAIIEMPSGWELYFTEEGYPYYYCVATKESHWELPESVGSMTVEGLTVEHSSPFDLEPVGGSKCSPGSNKPKKAKQKKSISAIPGEKSKVSKKKSPTNAAVLA